eukprot:scaffold47917_cov45-Attheya_sp.AAC.2
MTCIPSPLRNKSHFSLPSLPSNCEQQSQHSPLKLPEIPHMRIWLAFRDAISRQLLVLTV